MKKNNFLRSFILINLLLGSLISGFAQTSSDKDKRTQEHQSIKNLLQRVNTSIKYSSQLNDNLEKIASLSNLKNKFAKTLAHADRKNYFMNGNKISTEIYNYGGIAPGYGLLRNVNNLVWRGVSYAFQFCPFIAASVPSGLDSTHKLHIISDGLWDYPNLREVNPTGDTLWGWQPLKGFADPSQGLMASNPAEDKDGDGKPDSWPREWYNPTLGKYVWPGYLAQDATNADLEVFWAMDDRDNAEFPYWPFPSDSSRRGLGVQVDGRALQWSNALAENTIFFVYTITNVSEKNLDSIYFGMYGDPDVGGGLPVDPGTEVRDDLGFFVSPFNYDVPVYARSMVYFWDEDGKGHLGLPVGYLGAKYLESPSNPENGIDDDGDGMTDETQDDGIDNDRDWNPVTDDIGIDGIPNTGDLGEGDGVPTAGKRLADGALDPLYPGEPNFELTDLDESDQIGLTSFNSWTWNTDKVSNDESMWFRIQAGNFGDIQQLEDIVFIFGSGPIALAQKEIKRFSMALSLGENLDDLLISAETVQRIYNANYRFFRPPTKPTISEVPGDKKVTLFWDTKAEESIDPITGRDFEGYVIYRSTDPTFNDIQTITDGKGSKFLYQPLRDVSGVEAKWDVAIRPEPFSDLNGNTKYDIGEPYVDMNGNGIWDAAAPDYWKGYHPVEYQGRGVHYFLGNNRGLVHSYVDSNNVINGQTYYYAVVAYDHGDSLGIPPTETTKKITIDPVTSTLTFDVNTVQVIPGPRASGYISSNSSTKDLVHEKGIGNGEILIQIMDDLAVKDKIDYRITFADSFIVNKKPVLGKNYSVLRLQPELETGIAFYDTNFSKLKAGNLSKDSLIQLKDDAGTIYTENLDYVIDYSRGLIRRTNISSMPVTKKYSLQYRYYPIYQSRTLRGEDDNDVFEGIKLKVKDYDALKIDTIKSKWIEGKTNYTFNIAKATIGGKIIPSRADYEIRFSKSNIDSAMILIGGRLIKFPVKYSVREVTTGVPQPALTFLKENAFSRDSVWNPGEEIIIFKAGSRGLTTDTTTWGIIITKPTNPAVTPIDPTDGDVLFVSTQRPFLSSDQFNFRSTASSFDASLAKGRLDNIYVVPNPYVAINDLEPSVKLPGQNRGERRIYFENLPPECTIRIFTLTGELVQTINHYSSLAHGREFWNLLNRDGFSVSYGIYLAHIDAPGIGEKLIKFAIIK
ncbi:MAG: hypothetical protein FJ213_05035 [Ignavibacteria bacterium]|nr:hypothetical protein [Ignavibacteria bacterium]